MAKSKKNADYQKTTAQVKDMHKSLKAQQDRKAVRTIIVMLCVTFLGGILLCIGTRQTTLAAYLSFVGMLLSFLTLPIMAANVFAMWKNNVFTKIGIYTVIGYYFSVGVAAMVNAYVSNHGIWTYVLIVGMVWAFTYTNTK